ncbi:MULTISPECIES: gluconokinase [Virgibacillus]|uniref:Xylulose kinase n=2 Tax=Virgibacillus TaxID=84406 RepID=A0A024Q7B3_9BACI|nr:MULTISPECIES: gluconokinase [Virgibacillus]EQB38311.1 gluconokinase [Virgibacillus sp. CM-4]MYL41016.1 gluconokinase [Virgibacillus massiliensis]GGJ53583.1 gluconate kinase [Virgibacillus kapii]CDQ38182.1 Xylulose kinase [Virgibacillus massiliensis]
MSQATYYLGVDIGTTSTKAVLFNKQGEVITNHTINYPLHTPNPLVAEQDPDEIFNAVSTCIRETVRNSEINPGHLQFVSFSSAMHSFIAVDKEGKLLTNSITWADTRSATHAEQIKQSEYGHLIYRRTGTPIHPMSPLSKLVWLKDEKPELFNQAAKFISIKEYVFYRLFGKYVVDHSIASATGLLNLEKLDWDTEALEVAGITSKQLSTLVPTTEAFSGLDEELSNYMGIHSTTKFIIGASDGVLSNLGVNAIEPGVIAVTIGTSGAIRTVSDKPRTDPKGRIFCYALTEDHWVIGGPVNNGGMILRWLRDEFAAAEVETAKRLGIDPYDVLTKIASGVNPGSDGLIFHPYMTGERAPLWNANARASFFGLSIHHEKQHMIRAVLEGVIYNLYTVLLALEELTGEPKRIQATGGFARSEMWRQLMADIFDKPVVVPESYESSCLGAVVLGMYGTGEISDFRIVSEMIGHTHTHHPNDDTTTIYRELLPIFIRLSRILDDEYKSIADFQRKYLSDK